MANVQFYRLGMNSPVSKEKYESYKVAGNIIFARVDEKGTWSVDTSTYVEPLLYIWANGVEYKIADKAALDYVMRQVELLNADSATPGSVAYQILQAINSLKPAFTVGESDPSAELTAKHGDYYIKEVTLADNSKERTAYIYDENTGWRALDGNVNAEHVIINSAITLSGNYDKIGNMSKGDVVAAGTTVKKLFDDILAKEVYPSSLAATYKFTSSAGNPAISIYKAGTTTAASDKVEVGTMVDLKAVFGAQSTTELVEAKTFNNGTTKGYATDKSGTDYTNSETYTLDLSSDVTANTANSSLALSGLGSSTTAAYGNAATISGLYVGEGAKTISATLSNITYTSNWDNLDLKTLYAISNIGNYSDAYKVEISKDEATTYTDQTKTASNTSASKTITGYWPIYWGYVNEGQKTFSSDTFTVDWIKANKAGKLSSFALPYNAAGKTGCFGLWFALPTDNLAASATWDVINETAGSSPQGMAADTKKAVNDMTSDVEGTTCAETKNYVVQYWCNAAADSTANKFLITKA